MPPISTVIRAEARKPIPEWALRERHLIRAMNEAALVYQERYTRQDGTFVRRESRLGFDASDDGYTDVNDQHFRLVLPPGRSIKLRLGMRRYSHTPSYVQPI